MKNTNKPKMKELSEKDAKAMAGAIRKMLHPEDELEASQDLLRKKIQQRRMEQRANQKVNYRREF